MIHISNRLYLNEQESLFGNPIIGYQSILNITNVSADSDPIATPVINLVNEQTNQYWISDSTDEQYFYFDNPDAEPINYIGIAKHNFGTAQIEYQLQSSEDASAWSDVTGSFMPSNDNAILHFFDEIDPPFFRIRLDPGDTQPRIAHAKLGQALVMPRCIKAPHTAITLSRDTNIITNTAEDGSYLGRIVTRRYLETQYAFKNVRPDFYREHIYPFSIHAETGTFFIAWKPVTYPTEVAYGWTKDRITFNAENDNGMGTVDFGVKAVA